MVGVELFDALDHAVARISEHGESLKEQLAVFDLTEEELRALVADRWDVYVEEHGPIPDGAAVLLTRSFMEGVLTGLQYEQERGRE